MIKLNRDYSDYTDLDDEKYPNGKAIDCSTDESYDGTPIKKELINDLHGALEAVVKEAEGDISGVSGQPDNIEDSDFKKAIKKLIDTPDNVHAALRGPDAHGATVAATPGQIITRDDNGRAQVADPAADSDIANKGWVSRFITSVRQLFMDVAHPINDIYVQYPSIGSYVTKNPMELYNKNGVQSNWVELDYGGAFFRSNGGLSKNFNSGKQAEGLPNIKGSLVTGSSTPFFLSSGTSGAFTNNETGLRLYSGPATSNYDRTSKVLFDASKSNSIYGASSHVTTENYTIKIWHRTA